MGMWENIVHFTSSEACSKALMLLLLIYQENALEQRVQLVVTYLQE